MISSTKGTSKTLLQLLKVFLNEYKHTVGYMHGYIQYVFGTNALYDSSMYNLIHTHLPMSSICTYYCPKVASLFMQVIVIVAAS